MKRAEKDRLLREIFTGDQASEFRQTSLERTLTSIRRNRRAHRAACVGALTFGLALLCSQILSPSKTAPQTLSAPARAIPQGTHPSGNAFNLRFITDEELFALFPNRTIALIGKAGNQQLVFLDEPYGSSDGGGF